MTDPNHLPDRRTFLKAAGSLTVSLSLWGVGHLAFGGTPADPPLPGSLRRFPQINAWVEILEDGGVRIFSGKVELGQGIRIAIKQVAAEELMQELDDIEIVLAETGRTPDEGYTAGSGSIQNSAMAVRYAAAAAREKLLDLASQQMKLPKEHLKVVKGAVAAKAGNTQIGFYDLLHGHQIEEKVSLPVDLVAKADYRYVGKPIRREDLGHIVTGQPWFIQDMSFPGMLHARALRPPSYDAELESLDEAGFQQGFSGEVQLVRKGRFVGLIAPELWVLESAMKVLPTYCRWSAPASLPGKEHLYDHIQSIASAPEVVAEKDWEAGERQLTSSLEATFYKPYTMHASLGPACAVALYTGEVLHIWTHSQGVYPLREALATMLGMAADKLHLISMPGAGCFGHTVADDAAADAALFALAQPGKQVRVQWTREDENAWEPYGSAMIMHLRAGLDDRGRIDFWQGAVWTDSHSTRPNRQAGTVLAARHLEPPQALTSRGYLGGGYRNAEPYYDIPHQQINAHYFDGPLRVSSLRSLGAYANIFAMESFMDQLAAAAGQDPVEFRLAHLRDPRAREVLQQLKALTLKVPAAPHEGLGYAFCRYKNNAAYCAVAAQVWVDPQSKAVRLRKLWATIDVGEVIHPDGLRNQTEGGMVQAASWTLKEAVAFDEQGITSKNWGTYPVLRMDECPELEVHLIDRPEEAVMGGGEASVPPTGAAIANAVFRACGQRIYELPIRLNK